MGGVICCDIRHSEAIYSDSFVFVFGFKLFFCGGVRFSSFFSSFFLFFFFFFFALYWFSTYMVGIDHSLQKRKKEKVSPILEYVGLFFIPSVDFSVIFVLILEYKCYNRQLKEKENLEICSNLFFRSEKDF